MRPGTAIAAALALAAAPAAAAVIADTGPSPTIGRSGLYLDPMRIAAGFHTGAATLTSVEWGLYAPGRDAAPSGRQLYTYHIVLYRADGGVPGAELYSIAARFNGEPGWHGASGLAWQVPAGDYFVAIEVRAGDACECAVADATPRPLAHYAVSLRPDQPYRASPGPLGSAVRIEGAPAAR